MSDTLLITRKTFEEIYSAHYADVYRYIYWKTADCQTAEDLTQDVFIKAWKAKANFEGRSAVKTWLISIASNHLKDYYKSCRDRHMTDCSHLELVASCHDTENHVIVKYELKTAEEAILSLPDAYKESFVLVRYNGMSYADAAAALNISIDLLKVRVHRAHKMLTQKLSGGDI